MRDLHQSDWGQARANIIKLMSDDIGSVIPKEELKKFFSDDSMQRLINDLRPDRFISSKVWDCDQKRPGSGHHYLEQKLFVLLVVAYKNRDQCPCLEGLIDCLLDLINQFPQVPEEAEHWGADQNMLVRSSIKVFLQASICAMSVGGYKKTEDNMRAAFVVGQMVIGKIETLDQLFNKFPEELPYDVYCMLRELHHGLDIAMKLALTAMHNPLLNKLPLNSLLKLFTGLNQKALEAHFKEFSEHIERFRPIPKGSLSSMRAIGDEIAAGASQSAAASSSELPGGFSLGETLVEATVQTERVNDKCSEEFQSIKSNLSQVTSWQDFEEDESEPEAELGDDDACSEVPLLVMSNPEGNYSPGAR